jgi:hypothetical protein
MMMVAPRSSWILTIRSGFRCEGRVHKFLNAGIKGSGSARGLVAECVTVLTCFFLGE